MDPPTHPFEETIFMDGANENAKKSTYQSNRSLSTKEL
jgi:hypothetical protein